MPKLGVNIDHIATLRQARREFEPDPLSIARLCELAGADSIVAHLREDRRHIQDADIIALREKVRTRFNLEMSLDEKIVKIALKIKPDQITLVPEKRAEITTEGGLDVLKHAARISKINSLFQRSGIEVSLFIDPVKKYIQCTKELGIKTIEIHTGQYAHLYNKKQYENELKKIAEMTFYAHRLGLVVNAGHGLKYDNVKLIAQIPNIHELNIGHSIVSRAVFVGIKHAVMQMKKLVS
jgi:pyridoxine 5-phosphate synthase